MINNHDIKTDQYGYIDTAYYMAEARKLRGEHNAELIAGLKVKVTNLLSFNVPSLFRSPLAQR